ncbi:MAG: glycoside hydrolase family 19 protein [Verrucomicrobia bacterium]|nr:glycoside hydrolase family 19 protein [Leptolyngbya sp. ES-bin-22]
MAQLDVWRIQALIRLASLISKLQGAANKNDELVDNLIRVLSNLPPRPADKPSYMGLFSVTDVKVGRQGAASRVQELTGKLQGAVNDRDGLVDNALRSLSNLPARPAGKQPYAGLFPTSTLLLLTAQQLLAIAPEASTSRINTLTPFLNRTMVEFNVSTPLRQAHFLAQVAHESDRFNALEEYASGEDYEDRDDLGNTQAGDGVRYKGRGLIQVTGRTNYGACGRALGIDLINNPTQLAEPDLASRSAGWFWASNQLNGQADNDDVRTVTRLINGGYNGLNDRIRLLQAAKRVLKV